VAISTKDAWLNGPGDLQTAVVEDVPVKGSSVKVRGLPAAFSARASSEALKMITGARGEQTATVDTAKMSILQFAHGCVEPSFTEDEARQVAEKFGPAFNRVVAKIDELSGVDKEAIDSANERFQTGVEGPGHDGEAGSDSASANGQRSAVPSGTGA
jgi:hypothetical protein